MPAAAQTRCVTPQAAILTLLAERAQSATICPNEAARRFAGPEGDWRAEMDTIHLAADALVAAGTISLSWKDNPMQKRRGPYRIARR